jgi:hypothetical protein
MDAARRGRLSEIDLLPEWADEAKLWAFEQLKKRKKSQLDILDEFNARLKAAALAHDVTITPPVISRSAFNRTALKIAKLSNRLEETRAIAQVLAPKLDEAGDNSVTLMVAETIKTLTLELLTNAGEMKADGETATMLRECARAISAAEQAKRISADTRRKIEAELKDAAAKAVDQVAREKGLSAEAVNAIREQVLGIRKKPETKT